MFALRIFANYDRTEESIRGLLDQYNNRARAEFDFRPGFFITFFRWVIVVY